MANKYLKMLKEFITDKNKRFLIMNMLTFNKNMPDEEYLIRRYKAKFGKEPDLVNPKTYSEKCQWLKLHDFQPVHTTMVDKYEAKKYVADIIGEEHIIPTLKVWDKLSDIDYNQLPEAFVLKCTHDSGGFYIVRDKSKLDKKKVQRKLGWRMKRNFYYTGREKAYKDIKPRIIAEKYMSELSGHDLVDYKFFCFDGKPELVLTVAGGHEDASRTKRQFYTTDWDLLDVGVHGADPVKEKLPKPEQLGEMLDIAKKLSAGQKHVRVDLYSVGGQIYFGELTFFHNDGLETFTPKAFDRTLGDYIKLDL